MIRLILIVITVANAGRYSAAVATIDDIASDIVYDITESICKIIFFEQAYLYLGFCADDGFKKCGKYIS